MLRELDFIEGEWAALFWALGSATAILRHAASSWRMCISRKKGSEERHMNPTGKKALGVASGMVLAITVALSAFGLLRLVAVLFPGLGLEQMHWTHWLGAIVVPEIIFVVSAILLWRRRTPIAAGILLTAIGIGVHVAVHLAMR
jgi:hypothetical protein